MRLKCITSEEGSYNVPFTYQIWYFCINLICDIQGIWKNPRIKRDRILKVSVLTGFDWIDFSKSLDFEQFILFGDVIKQILYALTFKSKTEIFLWPKMYQLKFFFIYFEGFLIIKISYWYHKIISCLDFNVLMCFCLRKRFFYLTRWGIMNVFQNRNYGLSILKKMKDCNFYQNILLTSTAFKMSEKKSQAVFKKKIKSLTK